MKSSSSAEKTNSKKVQSQEDSKSNDDESDTGDYKLIDDFISKICIENETSQTDSSPKTTLESLLKENEKLKKENAYNLEEIAKLQEYLKRLNDKLIKEIEQRAELQHEKDVLSTEIEDLTKGLFEQANGMVATEARMRHDLEMSCSKLKGELQQTKQQLEQESKQLRIVRLKLAEAALMGQKSSQMNTDPICNSDQKLSMEILFENSKEICRSQHFKEFLDFIKKKSKVTCKSLIDPSNIFLYRVFKEEIEPNLNFPLVGADWSKTAVKALLENLLEITNGSDFVPIKEIGDVEKTLSASTCALNGDSSECLEEENAGSMEISLSSFLYPDHSFLSMSQSSLPELHSKPENSRISCFLCGDTLMDQCDWRTKVFKFRLNMSRCDSDAWQLIDLKCRDRLVSVAEFFKFCRSVSGGLYDHKPEVSVYFDYLVIRRQMFYSKMSALAFYIQFDKGN